ncbi:MAG: L,D-transpeptidase family protein [Pyrinomonadaceae bacterium]|jgi:hypothetical protein|nr:L,D-transpeptidase family protein [Pyrinomonadaceae bacterium]
MTKISVWRNPIFYVLLTTLALAGVGFYFWQTFLPDKPKIPKTVKERIDEYGNNVRQRLEPDFQRIGVSYPPNKILLVGLKDERKLEVWVSNDAENYKLLKTYPFYSSTRLGPKLKQGDWQTPEGFYQIESLNPNSSWHLSLRVNYPNDFDRKQAKSDGREKLGGDIMIHGNWLSVGCLAIGDAGIEEVFILAAESNQKNIPIILSPVDFRVRELPSNIDAPRWMFPIYNQIKVELLKLRV